VHQVGLIYKIWKEVCVFYWSCGTISASFQSSYFETVNSQNNQANFMAYIVVKYANGCYLNHKANVISWFCIMDKKV